MAKSTKIKQLKSLQNQLKRVEKSNARLAENIRHKIATLEKTKSK